MKVKINFRALVPYDETPSGEPLYHFYEHTFNAIKVWTTAGTLFITEKSTQAITGELTYTYLHEQVVRCEILPD